MQEGIESIGEFVVSRGEATELLKAIEESLDEVARLVAVPVDLAWRVPVAMRWNDGLSAGSFDDLNEGIAVIALVGDDRLGGYGFDQGSALGDVGHLASGQDQPEWIAQRIHAGMDLGDQPAPRAADRLIATFFWARRLHAGGPERWWRR